MRTLTAVLLLALLIAAPGRTQESAPLPEGDGTLRRLYVPILMYHYVSPLPPDADDLRINLTVEPGVFRSHMAYLREQGYTTVSLNEVDAALMHGAPLPARPVVLTFDDGHIDHYETVFPILREFGFTGTFFIITSFADNSLPGYVSWAQIQQMAAAGMHMGAHTKSHPDLRGRDRDFLVYQIMGSIESLNAFTQTETRNFAYPGGFYDDAALALLRETPIQRAVTTIHGAYLTSDNRYQLPRLRISGNLGVAGLAQLLGSG